MEPEEPATGLHPEPDDSKPHSPILFLYPFKYLVIYI
jgi:hypothetical protein